MRTLCGLAALMAIIAVARADIYLQHFRGSNNRLDEANRDRNNANRLFDSQNNNRGGVNVGSLYFYEGERVPVDWTAQHGCGNDNNDCQLVLQYMCGDALRDGVTTRTIPDQPANCLNNDCNNDVRFGMHETYDYYTNCKYRFRNRGLFTADRQLNGNTARFTRQNNNGERRGYECPEERDYYPYWHPTDWIDLAIFTNDESRCELYRNQSENVVGRHYCWIPDAWYHQMVRNGGNGNNGFIPNTERLCLDLNKDGSAMTNFLKAENAKKFTTAKLTTQFELRKCTSAVADCVNLESDPVAQATCFTNFNRSSITADQLELTCPPCGKEPDTLWKPHPYADCRVCVPKNCTLADYVPANETAYPSNGCGPGFKRDLATSSWCVSDACFNKTNTFEDQLAVDDCRKKAVENKFLVDWNSTAVCIEREILSADCFARNIKRAAWVRAPSHMERFPDVVKGPPECTSAAWSRPNHLGNGIGGYNNGWNWTFPAEAREHCAFRIRYNITTWDYNGLDPHNSSQVNSTLNRRANGEPAQIRINEAHNIPTSNSDLPYENKRGYLFRQNPQVQIFDFSIFVQYCRNDNLTVPNDPTKCFRSIGSTAKEAAQSGYCPYTHPNVVRAAGGGVECANSAGARTPITNADKDFELQLAINTNQFGRTFQDRSHRFKGVLRSPELAERCNNIYSLSVRGKRGNIVQTYPSTEYDFVPDRLHVAEGDCIHFQWTGSNTNPENNDGQGRQGTDRSNIALLEYVRGEGGRGVESFGGKGAGGTTWTTKDMEPGWEGWVAERYPTMGDMQCPPPGFPTYSLPHPGNWKKCMMESCAPFRRPTQTIRGATPLDPPTIRLLDCPTRTINGQTVQFRPDTEFPEFCVRANVGATVFCSDKSLDRPLNSKNWSPSFQNLVQQIGVPDAFKRGGWGTSHPEHLNNVTVWGFLGLNRTQLIHLATLDNVQFGGEMSELDDAGTYFDLPVHKVTGLGTHHYLCTRNNNFSNRSQQGKIVVSKAPEAGKGIGPGGGVVGINLDETFRGIPQSDPQVIASSDFSIYVPPKTVNGLVQVQAKILPSSDGFGMKSAASDVLWVGPNSLSSTKIIPDFTLSPPDGVRRRVALSTPVSVSMRIFNSTALWYNIRSDGFKSWWTTRMAAANTVEPKIQIQFLLNNKPQATVDQTLNGRWEIEGMWAGLTPNQVISIEKGELSISIWVDQDQFVGTATVDPESGKPIEIRIPVSVTMEQGRVYYWPDNETGRRCITNSTKLSGCSFIRKRIDSAQVTRGEAIILASASKTVPAAGFYQVSAGNDLPVIVGVTVACIVIMLSAIGAAVYFRKHPDKWSEAKLWGPRQYKSLKRSFASHV